MLTGALYEEDPSSTHIHASNPSNKIQRVLIVVPANDEEELLPACLQSLQKAIEVCPVPAHVVVVADSCTDNTATIAHSYGVQGEVSDGRNVGRARKVGIEAGLKYMGWCIDHHQTWLAMTDADSVVPRDWLKHRIEVADEGADMVVGIVDLPGPSRASLHIHNSDTESNHVLWRESYAKKINGATHAHSHGANLGIRMSVYKASGGFGDLPCHEDGHLIKAVSKVHGANILWLTAQPVCTSDRHYGRCSEGVARDIRIADTSETVDEYHVKSMDKAGYR